MKHRLSGAVAVLACAALVSPGCHRAGAPRQLRIAAAADLRFALDELVAAFRRAHPDEAVTVSYGSSGTFYAQLSSRAPFDLFLSADLQYAQKLADARLTAGAPFTYAVGRIVVWVPAASPLAVERRGLDALVDPAVAHVAIANPAHAPYGRAAEAALRGAGIYDAVRPKLVFGENIAQTLQFVQGGAADIGIVALSLALAPTVKDHGRYFVIPADNYPPIAQGGVIMRWAIDADAARAFQALLTGPDGRALLARYGFSGA